MSNNKAWLYDVSPTEVETHLLRQGDRGVAFQPHPTGVLVVKTTKGERGTYAPDSRTYADNPF